MRERGLWRHVKTAAMVLAQAGVLLLLALALDGFHLSSLAEAIGAVVVISFVIGFAWPYLYRLASRVTPILFPFLMLLLTGLVVSMTAAVLPGVDITTFWSAVLVPLVLTASSVVLGGFLAINDAHQYERFVTRQIQRSYSRVPKSDVPGIAFIEIDGLAEPILRQAIDEGRVPTIERWLAKGHRLIEWEPDLSSQTSASQAGILLGDNTDIPAFRWYDKEQGRLVVSSKFHDAGAIEAKLSKRIGLLAQDGASRLNMMSGDAPDCLFTFSTFGAAVRKISSRDYYAYFSNPYSLGRVLTLFVMDVFLELWFHLRQRLKGGPRVKRGGVYPFVRAGTTSFMQELSVYMVVRDLLRGVPAVYTTLFSYDEVAHHSGIRAPDALAVLTRIDHHLRYLERAAALAPRPYHLVVLSDHGQSEGATFKLRFGKPLQAVVDELTGGVPIAVATNRDEHVGGLNLILSEAVALDARTSRVLRRLLRRRTEHGAVQVGPETEALRRRREGDRPRIWNRKSVETPAQAGDAVVLASGNLGLISFTGVRHRLTFEEITDTFPDLLPGLVQHPGIGFVMVHSAEHGAMAIGAGGIHYLDQGYAAGNDPLATFGPNAAAHLRRTDRFRNAPEILVNSLYRPDTGETAAFEELLGNHGGLGGSQTQPFILYPEVFDPIDGKIVGAASVHNLLCGWLQQVQGTPHPALTQDTESANTGAPAPIPFPA